MRISALGFRAAWVAAASLVALTAADARLRAQPEAVPALSAPAAPVNLSGAVNGSAVTLTWQPGGGDLPSVYQLEVGSAAGASNLLVTQVTATTISGTGVPNGAYFVRVRAINGAGASNASNELTLTVGGCGGSLSAPADFVAGVLGHVVTFTWGLVPGATGYQLAAGSAAGLSDLATAPVSGPGLAVTAPAGVYYTRVHALSPCGASASSNEAVVSVGAQGPPPPPTTTGGPIWGVVDPGILGTCSAEVHDRYVINDGDGFRYRTWHPQTVPVDASTSCTFAHEHGDDPASQTHQSIKTAPVRFGYAGRRHPMPPAEPNGHEEPHEGFKVFVANRGAQNEELRTYLHDSRLVFHMGTGGPRRFTMPHHSMEYASVTNDGRYMLIQGMANTGGVSTICAPTRAGKTVVALDASCRLGSLYEIWENKLTVRANGAVLAQAVASTAVFDPITALDPANPTRLLYMWDAAMSVIKQFPENDWSLNRGCDREAYHGPTYWYNSTGLTTFYTDAMGNEVPANSPLALAQIVSPHDTHGGFYASIDGNETFKFKRGHCGQRAALGVKN
jgi:hypothetical protein